MYSELTFYDHAMVVFFPALMVFIGCVIPRFVERNCAAGVKRFDHLIVRRLPALPSSSDSAKGSAHKGVHHSRHRDGHGDGVRPGKNLN